MGRVAITLCRLIAAATMTAAFVPGGGAAEAQPGPASAAGTPSLELKVRVPSTMTAGDTARMLEQIRRSCPYGQTAEPHPVGIGPSTGAGSTTMVGGCSLSPLLLKQSEQFGQFVAMRLPKDSKAIGAKEPSDCQHLLAYRLEFVKLILGMPR